MNALLAGLAQRTGIGRAWPLAGVATVFRKQRRRRQARGDLAVVGVLLACIAILTALLQRQWPQGGEYFGSAPDFLARCLTASLVSAALVFLTGATVLGAVAAPSTAERETTQAALLTRLTALDLSAGLLLAALWPLFCMLLISCGFWGIVATVRPLASGGGHGIGSILVAHLVLFCGVYMNGALGLLFALRRSPGRSWGRGAGVALAWTVLCVTGILLVNRQIQRMDDPTRLIEGTLVINPVTAVATAFDLDLLRTELLYAHTDAHDFPFVYPAPLASAGLFALLGLAAQGLSTFRLRRAYR